MITYKVLPQSLLAQLEPHGFCHVDGKPSSDDDAACQAIIDAFTLDQFKAERSAEVIAHAKAIRDRVTGTISAGEMASWSIKRAEAQDYAAQGASAKTPLLTAEAQARGMSLDVLVSRVAGNSAMFSALEAAIGGTDGKHRDAIASLTTFDEVAAYDYSGGWPGV